MDENDLPPDVDALVTEYPTILFFGTRSRTVVKFTRKLFTFNHLLEFIESQMQLEEEFQPPDPETAGSSPNLDADYNANRQEVELGGRDVHSDSEGTPAQQPLDGPSERKREDL